MQLVSIPSLLMHVVLMFALGAVQAWQRASPEAQELVWFLGALQLVDVYQTAWQGDPEVKDAWHG